MKHRLIIALLSLGILAAVVGGGMYWDWAGKRAPEEGAQKPTSVIPPPATPTGDLIKKATTSLRQLLPTLGTPPAEAQEGVAVASPVIIAVNEPADVTVTIQITDTRLIAGSVNLQRLDATGKVVAILGTLNDAGTNGDAVVGDRVFTIRKSFTESSTPLRLRVSWALRGVLQRSVSNALIVEVWRRYVDVSQQFSFQYPPAWTISGPATGLSLSSPGRASILSNPEEIDSPPEISISVLANPSGLTLDEFTRTYDGGWFTNYANVTGVTVGGRPARRFSDLGEMVGAAPFEAVFISNGASSIVLITITLVQIRD